MKYEVTNETKTRGTEVVKRIRALRDIPAINVRKGDFGGFVLGHNNLSQEGDAWIGEDAVVTGTSYVSGDAVVSGSSYVKDSNIFGDANIYGTSTVTECQVYGRVTIGEAASAMFSSLSGDVELLGKSRLLHSSLKGSMKVQEKVLINNSKIYANASQFRYDAHLDSVEIGFEFNLVQNIFITGDAKVVNTIIDGNGVCIRDHAVLQGKVHISGGNVVVGGFARLSGVIELGDSVEISELVRIVNANSHSLGFMNETIIGDVLIES